jgi:dTDP-4-amino-4,6-dideoxygalactose transaminase
MVKITSAAAVKRNEKDLWHIKKTLFNGNTLSGNNETVKQYEKILGDTFKATHAIAVSSGTAAIHCSLAALGIKKDDEVIVPVTAAVMSAIPILALNAVPIFVDIKKNSFAICTDSLRKKITKSTKCIISVPMWGYPTFSKDLQKISKEYDIPIIEDTAQAISTVGFNSKYEGTNGICGCFSTHELKLISTGEGGFVLTNKKELADSIRAFSKIGFSSAHGSFGHYMGLNCKLNAIIAALGISQLENLPTRLKTRKENATLWKKNLSDCKKLTPFEKYAVEGTPNYYGAVFLTESPIKDLAEILGKKGILTDILRYKYKLLNEYPVFAAYSPKGHNSILYPNAMELLSKLLILPTHEQINKETIQKASIIIRNLIEKN